MCDAESGDHCFGGIPDRPFLYTYVNAEAAAAVLPLRPSLTT